MSATHDRFLMPTIDAQKIAVKDMRLPRSIRQSIFPFLHLPRELRDQIYRLCLVAGDVEILRLSKLVNNEASQLLSKHATLRINLGFAGRKMWSGLCSVAGVQQVDLRIRAAADAQPFDVGVLAGLFDKHIIRESCVISLFCGKVMVIPDFMYHIRLFRQLARLSGFKNLAFKIVVDRWEFVDLKGILTEEYFHATFPYDPELIFPLRESYVRLQRMVESRLGPAKLDESVEGHSLEFHPLEPVPKDWSPYYTDEFEDESEDGF